MFNNVAYDNVVGLTVAEWGVQGMGHDMMQHMMAHMQGGMKKDMMAGMGDCPMMQGMSTAGKGEGEARAWAFGCRPPVAIQAERRGSSRGVGRA